MGKYHGGVVGGTHKRECGSKPWRATFKVGTKIEKTKTFQDESSAKKWRKKYSNKHGRTTNRWRKHPTLPNTIEMMVNKDMSVLFDEDKHPEVAQYVWSLCSSKRSIYTTKRVIASVHSTYHRRTGMRPGQRGKQSMLTILAPRVVNPRHLKPRVDNVIDNRLSNIGTRAEVEGENRKKKHAAQASAPALPVDDEESDDDFLFDY